MPSYLTVSLLGTVILLMETRGQVCFRSVKVTCVDFFSLILKPHLWNHFSIESRPRWRVDEAIIRLVCVNESLNFSLLFLLFQLHFNFYQVTRASDVHLTHFSPLCCI